ncbi:MAG: hypothetical protein JO110_11340 [Acetobacteraceae bacterium]|nr:hypothetical protein [Acetobacteraceae bacterium]
MAAISVVRITSVVTTRQFGIAVGEALLSDGVRARFRVLSRQPCCTVRLLTPSPLPEQQAAVEAWLERNGKQPTPEHRPVRWPTPRISLKAHVSVQAYCKHCTHVAALDLETLIRVGHGDTPLLELPLRCEQCR